MNKNVPTIGKIRGLSATSSTAGVFTILAFDHRQSFVKMIPAGKAGLASYEKVVEVKSSVVRALASHASGILLDPLYAAAQTITNGSLPGRTGLLVSVEKTGYIGDANSRVTELLPGWNVEKIKRMGANAAKLLIYYHPFAGELTEKQEVLTNQVIEECQKADIPIFVEAVNYSINPAWNKNSPEYARERPEIVTETARRLGKLNPDVLKLEFPVDVNYEKDKSQWQQACETVSEASSVPWTLLSAGVNFNVFAQQVEIACRAGASGFIGGRAIWKEGIGMPDQDREAWLIDVAAKRLNSLSEIAHLNARSWRSFYPNLDKTVKEGWYKDY